MRGYSSPHVTHRLQPAGCRRLLGLFFLAYHTERNKHTRALYHQASCASKLTCDLTRRTKDTIHHYPPMEVEAFTPSVPTVEGNQAMGTAHSVVMGWQSPLCRRSEGSSLRKAG